MRAPVDCDAVTHVVERDAFVPPLPLRATAERTLHPGAPTADEREDGMFPHRVGALFHQRRDPRWRRRSMTQSPIAMRPAAAATTNTVTPIMRLRPRRAEARPGRLDVSQPLPAGFRACAPDALSRRAPGRAWRSRAYGSWFGWDAETMKVEIIRRVPFCPVPGAMARVRSRREGEAIDSSQDSWPGFRWCRQLGDPERPGPVALRSA